MTKITHVGRRKVNYMMNEDILERMEKLVPSGERSDVVNQAVDEWLVRYGRRKAFEYFEQLKKKQKKAWSNDEIVKFIHDDRRRHFK